MNRTATADGREFLEGGLSVGVAGSAAEGARAPSGPSGDSFPTVSTFGRICAGLAVAAVAALIPVLSLGLLGDGPVGMQDNGDGQRLYCGAGLTPMTADEPSAWAGRVVVDFRVEEQCADPMPSLSLALLRLSGLGAGSEYSLLRLAWLYVAILAATAGWSAYMITRHGLLPVALLAPAVVPLAQPEISGFLLSTYAEPAGLLGGYLMLLGLPLLLVARNPGATYAAGVALTLGGGLSAAASKVPYSVLLLIAVAACILVTWRLSRPATRKRPMVVVVLVALAAVIAGSFFVNDLTRWQQRQYGTVNVFNLVYTLVLVEIPEAVSTLDLPASARQKAGVPAVLATPELAADTVVQTDPAGTVRDATVALVTHPRASFAAVGKGVQAATDGRFRYLMATPERLRDPGPGPDLLGEQGASAGDLHAWLDSHSTPWRGSVLIIAGLLAGVAGFRASRLLGESLQLAGLAAVSALALVVLGLADGYFELAKHVWLGGYFIDATAVALAVAAVFAVVRYVKRRQAQS